MSLPHALLGLLSYGPAAGYDLRTAFDLPAYLFWQVSLPQVYRTLRRMEREGWLVSTIEPQEGKPSRRVYRLTPAGRQELTRWLGETPPVPETRHPLLVKLFFGSAAPPGSLAAHVEAWRAHYAQLLRRYRTEFPAAIEAAARQPGAAADAPYWRLTLEFGRRHAQMMVEWCDAVLAALAEQTLVREETLSQDGREAVQATRSPHDPS
ncbi:MULTISPECIES: PadR family transcriptional regulator [Limnochorda]|uniref:PadR family transcriptional regulator n=1 Tax=Limnochorda TaxID=1676651 RepID=UPI0017DA2F5D|nr:PadR family transcriptional regulator [Limnochorda pilosa]NMA72097.1 PadR family transcriptional regulator [Bacillota bacterium]